MSGTAVAAELCAGSTTSVSCVLAFPHGDTLSLVKRDEARRYIDAGAHEIDMVVNYGYVRSGLWDAVTADIAAVTAVARPAGVPVKVIFETAQLTLAEICRATECAVAANADFVKTSTGFGGEGATAAGVRVVLETAAGRIKVKASGGIRDREQAELFIGLGVHRLGNGYSSTAAICSTGAASTGAVSTGTAGSAAATDATGSAAVRSTNNGINSAYRYCRVRVTDRGSVATHSHGSRGSVG